MRWAVHKGLRTEACLVWLQTVTVVPDQAKIITWAHLGSCRIANKASEIDSLPLFLDGDKVQIRQISLS